MAANAVVPYYYRSKSVGEVDFLIEKDGEILPLEIKSGTDYKKHKALNNLMAQTGLKEGIVLSPFNLERDDEIFVSSDLHGGAFERQGNVKKSHIDRHRWYLNFSFGRFIGRFSGRKTVRIWNGSLHQTKHQPDRPSESKFLDGALQDKGVAQSASPSISGPSPAAGNPHGDLRKMLLHVQLMI
jgi:hypothetical protein